MAGELAGKVAIVTGGARGIGQGIVELFVEEGARVLLADLDETRGAALAAALGGSVRYRRCDVSDKADIEALVAFALAEFGRLDVVVNNAAIPDQWYGGLLEDPLDGFDRILNVNLRGVMLGTQMAARQMAGSGGGSIINVSSIGGTRAGHGVLTYRASKAAVINFTQSAAIDLGPHMIRVNCICPGNIPTEMAEFNRGAPDMDQEAMARVRHAVDEVRMSRQPLKRQGGPRDVAQAAVFLASDRSRQITGLIMPVDGGATAGDALNLVTDIMDARARALGG